jgi:hypothetical protein
MIWVPLHWVPFLMFFSFCSFILPSISLLITTHPRVFPKITRQHPTEGIQYCNALGMPFFLFAHTISMYTWNSFCSKPLTLEVIFYCIGQWLRLMIWASGQGLCWMISMKKSVRSLLICGALLLVFWKVLVFISTMSSALKKVARREVSFVAGSLTQDWGATGHTQKTLCHYLARRKILDQSWESGCLQKDQRHSAT